MRSLERRPEEKHHRQDNAVQQEREKWIFSTIITTTIPTVEATEAAAPAKNRNWKK